MLKRLLKILLIVCVIFSLPIIAIATFVWYSDYREARNDFTIAQICSIKTGENIDDALKKLGDPVEYHTYNFSNVYSGQYRNVRRGYFVEISYTQDKGVIEEIFWGRGRTKTLAQSGVCGKSR